MLHGNKIAHEPSHSIVLYSDQVVLGYSCSISCRKFCSKVSCFSLPATCQGSHRYAEATLEYLNFLDQNEPLGAELIILRAHAKGLKPVSNSNRFRKSSPAKTDIRIHALRSVKACPVISAI